MAAADWWSREPLRKRAVDIRIKTAWGAMPALALSLIFFSALFVLRGGPAPQLNMGAERHTQKR